MQHPLHFLGFALKLSYYLLGFPLRHNKENTNVSFAWFDHLRILQYFLAIIPYISGQICKNFLA